MDILSIAEENFIISFGVVIGVGLIHGAIVKKLDVTDAIKKGKTYMTIFNSNDNWKIGEKIRVFIVEGEVFIRTDKNKVERDNLGLLPEI